MCCGSCDRVHSERWCDIGADKFLQEIVAEAFAAIDIPAAREVLAEMGLASRFSAASVAAIDAATNELYDEAAELKRAEAPRADRKAIRAQVDRLINARAFLYQLKAVMPGDVVVEPAPAALGAAGGND